MKYRLFCILLTVVLSTSLLAAKPNVKTDNVIKAVYIPLAKGSVFSISIPVSTAAVESDKIQSQITDHQQTQLSDIDKVEFSGNVLVVEDGRVNQMLIKLLLEKIGFNVTLAEDGSEGIEKAMATSFDIIFMDIQMPGINGHEATRTLRDNGQETPIIALTDNAVKGDEDMCLAVGCEHYLSKPIDSEALIEIVSKCIQPVQPV